VPYELCAVAAGAELYLYLLGWRAEESDGWVVLRRGEGVYNCLVVMLHPSCIRLLFCRLLEWSGGRESRTVSIARSQSAAERYIVESRFLFCKTPSVGITL
jgi:hypothetical protein